MDQMETFCEGKMNNDGVEQETKTKWGCQHLGMKSCNLLSSWTWLMMQN